MKVTLRWESAEPVREAARKAESPAAQTAEWAREFYVITASGMPMPGRRPGGPEGQQTRREPGPMADRMKDATTLKTKLKGPIRPERIEFVQTQAGPVIAFLFSRSEAIGLDDKEVTFESAMGPMQLKTKFTLKDMLYKGSPSL